MNKDERVFFKQMVTKYKDIIRIFPVLYNLQTHMVLIQIQEQQEQI